MIPNSSLQYIQRSSVPLEDHSVHLTPRIGITTLAMIPPLKQSQRLGRKLLYMPIDKAREKGTLRKSSNTPTLLSSKLQLFQLWHRMLCGRRHTGDRIFFSTCLWIRISCKRPQSGRTSLLTIQASSIIIVTPKLLACKSSRWKNQNQITFSSYIFYTYKIYRK